MNTKYLEQFERYYHDEMEPDERVAFEQSLANDPDLKTAYQEYLDIYEAIADKETLDLRIKLKEIREENAKKNKGIDFLSQGYNWLWMAALITIIISFTTIVTLLIRRIEAREKYAFELSAPVNQDMSNLDRELTRFSQRQIEFNLDSPKDSVFLNRKNPILFKWYVNSTEPLILELIDWQGRIVFSSGGPVESPYLVKKKLPGGIIAYRFRTETEAFRLGFLYLR
jgi:hypothetical protein